MSYKLLNFLQQFPVKKIRKKGKKKIHRFNVIRQITYVHGKKTFTLS